MRDRCGRKKKKKEDERMTDDVGLTYGRKLEDNIDIKSRVSSKAFHR